MKVLVDTSIWSQALRRDNEQNQDIRKKPGELISGHRMQIFGPIRQEILSGIREERQFEQLNARLTAFPDVPVATDDYVTAARCFNLCRRKGVQRSNIDFLICAIAVRHKFKIFTSDKDFVEYAKILPIDLF